MVRGIAAPTQPIRLSKRQAEQVLQHPLGGPCPQCRTLRNGDGTHTGSWLCTAPRYGGLLLRRFNSDEHLLRHPPAIAFEESIWTRARGQVKLVAVADRASPQIWWTAPSTFEERSFEINRGRGPQLALRLEHWSSARVVSNGPAEGAS